MIKRILPLMVVLALLVAFFVVPASATSEDLRSIYDGNLTNTESSALSKITPDDVKSASFPSYSLWRIMPWLYEQAGINVEFQGGSLDSQGAMSNIFYQPSGSTFWQVRPVWPSTAVQEYFIKQFTGLRGGTVKFQSASEVTYSNFNWFVGDLFIGMYNNGTVKYQYVALYQGRDFLEFRTGSDGSYSVYYSEMRDIFSRTYNYYAVIRPQSLSGEWNVINYNDFTGNMYVDGANDIVTLELPADLCGVQVNDYKGETYLPGQTDGFCIVAPNGQYGAGAYFPGSYITYTLLDLSNIPNGSMVTSSGTVSFETDFMEYGAELLGGIAYVGIQYHDEDFHIIGGSTITYKEFSMDIADAEYGWEESIIIDAPKEAAYCTYYMRFLIDEYISNRASIPVRFNFDVSTLTMSISSLYRQEEQTGQQNALLDQIVNGTVTPEAPSGSDSVGDLDDLESGLKDDTAAGRDEANQIFDDSFEPILGNSSGFLFWANVINPLVSIDWIRGLLVVSLALGIFGFLANIVMVAGRSGVSSSGRGGSSRGSGKGG